MSRDMMRFGGVGAIICMLAAIAGIVAIIMLWVSPIDYFFAGTHIDFGSGIAWAVGVALVSVGAFGLWKQYKNTTPLAAGIIGILALALGLAATVILWLDGGALSSISAMFSFGVPLLTLIGIPGIVWLEVNGVFLILLGISLVTLRERTGVAGATKVAGALALAAGASLCAIIPFGYLVAQGLILITTILLAYVLFKAKGIPGEERKEWVKEEAKEPKVKEAKKLAVHPVEEKKPSLKPEEIDEGVLKYVKKHPEGLDVAECAEKLGVSEGDVEKAVKALVKKGKLETE